jgi:cell division protein ZapA
MDKLSIKLKIWDREYPMKVLPEEEERIRKAGKLINDKIKSYREKFGIEDKQDLLSMVAFDAVIDRLELEKGNDSTDHIILEKLQSLNKEIGQIV